MRSAVQKLRQRQAKQRIAIVGQILREWDPLAIADIAPPDEYDNYAPPIVSLVSNGANAWQLAHHLSGLQAETFGVASTPAVNLAVAERIISKLALAP
jgi:hypothetical protein